MTRGAKIAYVVAAITIWAVLTYELHGFLFADRCMDLGGAIDSVSGACVGSQYPVDSLPLRAWVFVAGLPAALVIVVVFVVLRAGRKRTSGAA